MARDAREGMRRGNWRMEWVASTLHTTSEHGVSSITTADAHTSAVPVVDWTDAPRPIEMDSSVLPKDEIWFLRVCHHISNAVYLHTYRQTTPCHLPEVIKMCLNMDSVNLFVQFDILILCTSIE